MASSTPLDIPRLEKNYKQNNTLTLIVLLLVTITLVVVALIGFVLIKRNGI